MILPGSSAERKIQRTNRFGRDIRRIPLDVQQEAFRTRPLTGFDGIYRAVVVRDYRIIFFDEKNICLLRFGHRKEIYKRLEL
jgi:mRNA-degrading endonuclease RelE of RelBE toxin-antitoxin system